MRPVLWRVLAMMMVCAVPLSAAADQPRRALNGVLGVNKPDLVMQYLGTASSQDGSASARAVTVAMARKALADAHDIGFGYVRVMAAGFGPVAPPPAGNPAQNDLALWQSDAEQYWRRVDAMFDDLDRADIRLVPSFVWNPMQFPALAGETVADMIDRPTSRSRVLLRRFVADFITRYRARHTILFYELTNELNFEADIDIRARCLASLPAPNCAAYANFTSASMTAFARDIVQQIHALDPSRQIGSGYGLPRPSAFHLAAQPDFSPQGPDWTPDTREQFRTILARTNAPFGLWSVHVYPGDVRWGNAPGSEAATLALATEAARHDDHRLYLGEFGDATASPYLHAILRRLAMGGGVAYASAWVWEFYQQSTWQSANLTASPPVSLEPGFSDDINAVLARAAGGRGRAAPPAVRVVLTAPLPGVTLNGSADLYATASATGPQPVERVVFALDGVPVGTATTVPFHVTATPRGPGAHHVTATAYAGASMAQAGAQVWVGPDADQPEK